MEPRGTFRGGWPYWWKRSATSPTVTHTEVPGRLTSDVSRVYICPACGYDVSPESNIRDDDQLCCPSCYTVFPKE